MTNSRRNVMWSVLIILVGGIWLLMVADVFPAGLDDIFVRAWPILLVLFGFDVLFGRRQVRIARRKIDTSWIGLVVAVALLIGIVWLAYSRQADVVRSEHVVTFTETLTDEVNYVRLEVAVDRAHVTVIPAGENARSLAAEFKGSTESDVVMDWSVEGETGILTMTETHPSSILKLENYGVGTLEVTLPVDAVIGSFILDGNYGDITVDLGLLYVEQIELAVGSGDIYLNLPVEDVLGGKLRTDQGGIELVVPPGRALVLQSQGSGKPAYRYDKSRYLLLEGGKLMPEAGEPYQYSIDVWLKAGEPLTITDLE